MAEEKQEVNLEPSEKQETQEAETKLQPTDSDLRGLIRQQQDWTKSLKADAPSGISGDFGRLLIGGLAKMGDAAAAGVLASSANAAKVSAQVAEKGGVQSGPAGADHLQSVTSEQAAVAGEQLGDALAASVTASERGQIADRYESRARSQLQALHSDMSMFTKDGKPPAAIDFRCNVAIAATMTADQVAEQELGPNATLDQKFKYAQIVDMLNAGQRTTDSSGKEVFAAGTKLTLPGQTEDGGIVYRTTYESAPGNEEEKTVTEWSDGSTLENFGNGAGEISLTDETGPDVTVRIAWNHVDLTQNVESRLKNVENPPGSGEFASEGIERSVDARGRTVEQFLTANPPSPNKIVITDLDSNIIELTPSADGSYRGTKTCDGKVVKDNVVMDTTGSIYWEDNDPSGGIQRVFEDGSIAKLDKSGHLRTFDRQDGQGRRIHEQYSPGHRYATSVTITDKDNNVYELKLGKDHRFHGVKKDAAGKLLEREIFMAPNGSMYTESRGKGEVTQTFESGLVRKLDRHGNLIHVEQKDAFGWKVASDFRAGEATAYKTKLMVPGAQPMEFQRNASGRYVMDSLDAKGSKIGTMELVSDQTIKFIPRGSTDAVYLRSNGDMLAEHVDKESGAKTFVERHGAEQRSTVIDAQGRLTEEGVFTQGRYVQVRTAYQGGAMKTQELQIIEGNVVTSLSFDAETKTYSGHRTSFRSFWGSQRVTKIGDYLIVGSPSSADGQHAEQITAEGRLLAQAPRFDYDPDQSIISRTGAGGVVERRSLSPGRDEVYWAGNRYGRTVSGDLSMAFANGGAAVVHQADQTAVVLKPDGSLVFRNADGQVVVDKLSQPEQEFLNRHRDADRRDVAEVHRRLAADKDKIDRFYKELEKLESPETLTVDEAADIRTRLLHHVAFPSEIEQGRSPTCNVAVVQREMAASLPDKYVSFVTQVADLGAFQTEHGPLVHYDRNNLKMADESGRDLASRIFQSAAVHTVFYSDGKAFVNTEDGRGQIREVIKEETDGSGSRTFHYGEASHILHGLGIAQIARAARALTGQDRAGVYINDVPQLVNLFKLNGGRPMVVAVNGKQYPFENTGPVGEGSPLNHVVTITGMDEGPPLKFFIDNQWALAQDHPTIRTAVTAEDLVTNMTGAGGHPGEAITIVLDSMPWTMHQWSDSGDHLIDACEWIQISDDKAECH